MAACLLTIQAEHVERDECVGGYRAADPAHQTLRFFDADGRCSLIMNLVWPRGIGNAIVMQQARSDDGARD